MLSDISFLNITWLVIFIIPIYFANRVAKVKPPRTEGFQLGLVTIVEIPGRLGIWGANTNNAKICHFILKGFLQIKGLYTFLK